MNRLDRQVCGGAVPAGDAGQLRLVTCGSVDDGKSTLIGRLLFDAGLLRDDEVARLRGWATGVGGVLDYALLLDGLEAEREQGITIDVAYRYFATARRSFVVADVPGHEQYTRNMATGASMAQLALVLVNAARGIRAQTRRHLAICSLLGIRTVLLAVNKIDLLDYAEEPFNAIVRDYEELATRLAFDQATAIPVSARFGDNVVTRSGRTPWYVGPTLLEFLESVDLAAARNPGPFRFPVQLVLRDGSGFRGLAGTIASGLLRAGDAVVVVGTGATASVRHIVTADGDLEQAAAGDAVTIVLAEDVDVTRGDLLAPPENLPSVARRFAATVVWMADDALLPGRSCMLRIGTRWTQATVTRVVQKYDFQNLNALTVEKLAANDIGRCEIATASPIAFDAYEDNRPTGAFVLTGRTDNRTLAAGMILHPLHHSVRPEPAALSKDARAAMKGQRPFVLWFTGLPASGKSTISRAVEARLHEAGYHTYALDGDNLRHGLSADLDFSDTDRAENIRRAGEVARLFVDAGLIVLCAFISPFRAERQKVRDTLADGEFVEIFVDTPLEECMRRDPKGLYAKARRGAIKNFTGIDSAYEPPEQPDLILQTKGRAPDELAAIVLDHLRKSNRIG